MYNNLLYEMLKIHLSKRKMAKELPMNYNTLIKKFSGESDWHRNEMLNIRDKYFKDKTLEYLFTQNPQHDTD